MKNITQKLCLLSAVLFGFAIGNVSAAQVIGNTVYTDIVASINSYSIASFNINGYTAVVAEDLRNYGFDVDWVQSERALYISRNDTNEVASTYLAPEIPKWQVGKKAYNVLSTDIKTYIEGQLVTSYNIDGRTIIYFDDLNVFGDVYYNDSTRSLTLTVLDGLNFKLGNPYENDLYFTRNSVNGLCFYIQAVNNTGKTIKYFHVNFLTANSVFDPSYDMYGNYNFKINIVGPIYPGERIKNTGPDFGVDTYNNDVCSYVIVDSITVEYMDGTSEVINYTDIGTERSEGDGYNL